MNRDSLTPIFNNYVVKTSVYAHPAEKWVWLRIHKTAGTSMWDGYLRNRGGVINKSDNPAEYREWLSTVNLDDYFIWTFVRNPYDRFVSTARMFNRHPDKFAEKFHYLRKPEEVIYRHTHPQHRFVYTQEGERIPDFIGRFETLQQDFDYVCERCGIEKIKLPHLNKSRREGDELSDLSDKVIRFVNGVYLRDFELLHYDML